MATRFYGIANTAAPITPTPDAGWQSTTGFVRRKMLSAGGGGKQATTEDRTGIAITSGANNETLAFQLISEPLNGAQTISGTVTIMLRAAEQANTDNIGARARGIRVVSGDGTVVRGTLLAQGFHSVTTELGIQLRGYPAADTTALTSVSAQNGDRIVVEIGLGMTTTGTTPLYDMSIGGNGTDHAVAEADNTGTVPWIEFSQNLVLNEPVDLAGLGVAQGQSAENVILEEVSSGTTLAGLNVAQAQAAQSITSLLPLAETLVDDAEDNSLDATKWINAGGTPTEAGGRFVLDAASEAIHSKNNFDWRASYGFIDVAVLPTGTPSTWFGVATGGPGNYIAFHYTGTNLQFESNVATPSPASVAYNASTMRFWRHREAGGTWFFDTSADGVNWTNRSSVATPALGTGAHYRFLMEGGTGSFQIEAVNVIPGTTLAGMGVAQAQAATLGALTQVHNLAGLNVAQTQDTADPTLTQVHTLAGLGVAQAQSAQNVALVQQHTLAGLGVAQAQDTADPTLAAGAINLAGLNVAQAQATADPTLTQVHVLSGLGVAQGQLIGAHAWPSTWPSTWPGLTLTEIPASQPINVRPVMVRMVGGRLFQMTTVLQVRPLVPVTTVPTLSGMGVAQAQSAQGVILTQQHVLAGLNVAQAQAGTLTGLTQLHVLAGLNVAQGQSVQNVALTQVHVLAGLNVAQAQATADPTLAPGGALAGMGVAQAQSSTVIALTQLHVLAGLNVAQAQSAPNIPITKQSDLAGLNVAQAQAAANIALTQVHVLAGLGVAQTNRPQNIILGLPGALQGMGVAQAQTSTAIALTQLHVLAGLNVAQAQTAPNITLAQLHILAGLNVSQAQAAIGPLFTYIMAGMGVAQAQSAPNIPITKQSDLAGLNVAQAQAGTVIPLGVVLAGLNVAQAQKAVQGVNTTVALTQLHILAGLNVLQAQVAGPAQVTTQGTLSGMNVAQAQAAQLVVLVRMFNLLGMGVTQGQITTTILLGIGLRSLGVTQNQAATMLVLIQIHLLTGLGVLTPQQVQAIELGVGALPLRREGSGTLIGRRGAGGLTRVGAGALVGRRGGGGL